MAKTKHNPTEIEEKINSGIKNYNSLFWNSYQHMYDVRERNIQNRLNFLLLVATFLPLLSIQLFSITRFQDEIILVPIVFQLTALLILLKDFFIGKPLVHWFEIKETLKLIAEEKFDKDFFCNLKALEAGTHRSLIHKIKHIVKPSLFLIIFSLLALVLAFISVLLELSFTGYVLTISAVFFFCMLLFFYYKPANYGLERDFENCKNQYDWTVEEIEKKHQK